MLLKKNAVPGFEQSPSGDFALIRRQDFSDPRQPILHGLPDASDVLNMLLGTTQKPSTLTGYQELVDAIHHGHISDEKVVEKLSNLKPYGLALAFNFGSPDQPDYRLFLIPNGSGRNMFELVDPVTWTSRTGIDVDYPDRPERNKLWSRLDELAYLSTFPANVQFIGCNGDLTEWFPLDWRPGRLSVPRLHNLIVLKVLPSKQ